MLEEMLEEERKTLEMSLEEDLDEMKNNLKEVSGYNSYNITKAITSANLATQVYGPQQQRIFLTKFAYYMKDVIRKSNADLATMKKEFDTFIDAELKSAYLSVNNAIGDI